MTKQLYPPFFVVDMPIDQYGNGPAQIGFNAVKVVWEVWDSELQTVSVHNTEQEALQSAEELNNDHPHPPHPTTDSPGL